MSDGVLDGRQSVKGDHDHDEARDVETKDPVRQVEVVFVKVYISISIFHSCKILRSND